MTKRKYRNQSETVDNIRFASKAEAKRYRELKMLEKAGKIGGLILQPRYKLYGRNGGMICTYVADFQYSDHTDGDTEGAAVLVIEDVKGMHTPVFKLKAKLFRDNFGYDVTVIR